MTLGTIAHQALLSMGFSRQEHWSGFYYYLAITASLTITQVQILSPSTSCLVPASAGSVLSSGNPAVNTSPAALIPAVPTGRLRVWVCLLCGDQCCGEEQSRRENGKWPEVGRGASTAHGGGGQEGSSEKVTQIPDCTQHGGGELLKLK